MNKNANVYDPRQSTEAQLKYVNEHNLPLVAPTTGRCPKCFHNIYEKFGYSVATAASTQITNCPFCGKTFE